MLLTPHQRGAFNAVITLRADMARTGHTRAGQRLWSNEEVATLRRLYPDYRALVAALAGRTRKAIELKASKLGIARPLRIWSGDEERTMRPLYTAGVPVHEILALLNDKRVPQVWAKASRLRVRRPPKAPRPTPFPLVNSVRQRAFEMRISLAALDRDLGTGHYFSSPQRDDFRLIQRAVAALGGTFTVGAVNAA